MTFGGFIPAECDRAVKTRKCRLVLVCHVYPPEHAPAGVMAEELAESLATNGHDVTVLTGWPSHPAGTLFPGWHAQWRSVDNDPRGFRVIRCLHSIRSRERSHWRLWYYFTFAISSLVNGCRAGKFDAVLCLSTPFFGTWAAWALARIKGARFVYGIFDLHPEAAANAGLLGRGTVYKALRVSDTLLCRLSHSIVTLSGGIKGEIVARGITPERITVVPLWLDGTKVRPGLRENQWRREQGIPSEIFIALYAGTLGHVSGAEILVETARLLAPRRHIQILCVGEGPIKGHLTRTAARLGLTNLRCLPFQPARVLDEVQATADVGLVTLLPEASRTSIPSKVLGYLAAGRPVIASVAADSDTAEIVRQAGCGSVTPCLDPAALAEAICDLADDQWKRVQMGQRARSYFDRYVDRGSGVSTYESILCGKIATSPRGRTTEQHWRPTRNE